MANYIGAFSGTYAESGPVHGYIMLPFFDIFVLFKHEMLSCFEITYKWLEVVVHFCRVLLGNLITSTIRDAS